jgi:hypothetical protein
MPKSTAVSATLNQRTRRFVESFAASAAGGRVIRTDLGGGNQQPWRLRPAPALLPQDQQPDSLLRAVRSRAYMYCCSSATAATASASCVISRSSGEMFSAQG